MNNIKEFRNNAGYTLQDVADAAGIVKSYVAAVEKGVSQPTIRVAYAISKALHSDINVIFPDDNEYEQVITKKIRVVSK